MTTEQTVLDDEATVQVELAGEGAADATPEADGETETAATTPTPDLRELLSKADKAALREALKDHPVAKEIESEIGGRLGSKLEREREQMRATLRGEVWAEVQERQRIEREQRELEEMDDEDLGRRVKEDIKVQRTKGALETQAQAAAHQRLMGELLGGLSPEQRTTFEQRMREQPFKNYREFAKAVVEAERESDQEAEYERRLVEERKRWEQEERAAKRQGQPRPDLADGSPAGTDDDAAFEKAFSRGERERPEDYARMRRLLGM